MSTQDHLNILDYLDKLTVVFSHSEIFQTYGSTYFKSKALRKSSECLNFCLIY